MEVSGQLHVPDVLSRGKHKVDNLGVQWGSRIHQSSSMFYLWNYLTDFDEIRYCGYTLRAMEEFNCGSYV